MGHLQYLQCQAVHMEFGDVEAWDVYLASTTEKVRKTPKNVGDAGVMRHGGMVKRVKHG